MVVVLVPAVAPPTRLKLASVKVDVALLVNEGTTAGEVLACLDRGAASDGTRPEGGVYLVRGRDKRLRARMCPCGS